MINPEYGYDFSSVDFLEEMYARPGYEELYFVSSTPKTMQEVMEAVDATGCYDKDLLDIKNGWYFHFYPLSDYEYAEAPVLIWKREK